MEILTAKSCAAGAGIEDGNMILGGGSAKWPALQGPE
jgi:hypothetical protein